MSTFSPGAAASLLVLPAAMALTPPALAQGVISAQQAAPVNLAAYGGAGVSIASNVAIVGDGWAALWAANPARVNNAGQIAAANGAGIWLGGGGSVSNAGGIVGNDAVEMWSAGSVVNTGSLSAARYGVVVNGGAGTVSNGGAIHAGFDGVSLNRGGSVNNSGTIFGAHIGVYTGNGLGSVTNSGQISASRGDAVSLYSGGSLSNTASGRLLGGYSGVYAGGDGSRITNAGLISGPDFGVYLTGASSVSNSGTITGGIDGVIATGRGGVVANTGLITGALAGVKLTKGDTLDNAGTITGAAGIVANGAVAIADTGSIIATGGGNAISLNRGASTITLGTGAQIVGNIAGNGTASSISLTGSGTLSSTITGFGNGALTVAQGANWAGSGSWNVAQMVNNGSFSAGLAAAPLRLTGNFSQGDTGTLLVLVQPGQISSFTVSGTIKLGGTLSYVLAPGAYTPAGYEFLQAEDGLSGSFTQVAQTAPLSLVLTPKAAWLWVNRNFTVTPRGAGLLPDLPQAMALDGQSLDDLLLGHAIAPTPEAKCQPPPLPPPSQGNAALATAIASGFCAAGGWVEAAGSNLASADFNLAGGGFLAGVDRVLPATAGRIGLAAGYDSARLRGQGSGTADLETIRLGLYASQPAGAFVLAAALLDGIVSASTTRATGAVAAVAREHGNVLALAAQAALPLAWRGWGISPAAGLRVTRVALGALAERDAAPAFALSVRAAANTVVTPFLHVDVGRGYVTAARLTLTPHFVLGLEGTPGAMGARLSLASQYGTVFALGPRHLAPVSGLAGLGLRLTRGGWALDFGYQGRFAGNWSAQSLEAAISARF